VRTLGVDLLSIAGHKVYAPKGVGALYVRRGTPLAPFTLGAGHERGLRPGTENVAGIAGLAVACTVAVRDLAAHAAHMQELRGALLARLTAGVPGLVLLGDALRRLPNTLAVSFPGCSGTALLAAVADVAASTGSACHDGRDVGSAVLRAMGIADEVAIGAVRLSLGRGTTSAEIERAAAALIEAWRACGE
jgi:cysteine desulfurase